MLSTIEHLSHKLHRRWVPKWHEAFRDDKIGGFHERLGHSFQVVDTEQRRLVTQCRQIAIYSDASHDKRSPDFRKDLAKRFDFLCRAYRVPETGGWRFSIRPDGTAAEEILYDFYAHAFVIFTLSLYYKATKDDKAHELALQTLAFLDSNFRQDGLAGLVEGLDKDLKPVKAIRRQNPHMHLFEACLFAYETWGDPVFMEMARQMHDLFTMYFFDQVTGTLGEFFEDNLSPHETQGHLVEPGHHFEWVWLLKKYADLNNFDNPVLQAQRWNLLSWANTYGYDTEYGGIYDQLDRNGNVIKETKRIWPFAEALKANAMMLDSGKDRDELKDRMALMINVFESGYIEERGFWTETLNRDLSPQTDYLPGTTPYHLYFGITETLGYLKSRGKSKSWRSMPRAFAYTARRKLSSLIQGIFKNKTQDAA